MGQLFTKVDSGLAVGEFKQLLSVVDAKCQEQR
jgi:hypothetical protein